MGDYTDRVERMLQVGLNLREAPDKVAEGSWTRLHNVRSTQEAQIQPREGFTLGVSTGVNAQVHSIRRIDDSTLLLGVGTQLFRNGTAFATGGYSGNPLSITPYRPTVSSTSWAYVGDSNRMRKVRPDGTDFKWGVTRPANPVAFNAAGAGNLDSSVAGGSVYDWRATYYSSATGAESNPSDTANGIALVSQQASISVTASTDAQVDQIRLYRRGGTITSWRLSTTSPNVSGNVIDNNADSSIANNETLSEDRDVPFTTTDAAGNVVLEANASKVWGPFIGKYLMAIDPGRPGYVVWTNAQAADEASSSNNIEVTSPHEPLQNGLIYASLPFVASRDDWYGLDFGKATSTTFTPRKMPVGKGLAAPWAFCVGPMVWFLADDGIYETNLQGPPVSITEEALRPIFRGISVSNFSPVDYAQTNKLRMEYFANEVWFSYQDTQGNARILIYNTLYKRWRSGSAGVSSWFCFYNDENAAQARFWAGAANGNAYQIDYTVSTDDGNAFPVNCRTGSSDSGAPTILKEYGNVIVDADPQGGTLTITPYTNTEQVALPSFNLTGSGRQKYARTLGDVRAYNLAFDISWAGSVGVIYQMDVLERLEEAAIRHWQFITTHGMTGWQHIRDSYFSIISTEDVTFTLNIDGVDWIYTIPSTNGARLKQYVKLEPTKGKVFKYSLDCPSDFRLFGAECEIRVKAWNTSLGYQLMNPFQGSPPEA